MGQLRPLLGAHDSVVVRDNLNSAIASTNRDTLRGSCLSVVQALGVSAAYIVGEFYQEAQEAACVAKQRDTLPGAKTRQFPLDTSDPVFHDIAPVMCYGEAAKGFGMQCPRDRQVDCAVVDALHSQGKAGPANQFLSWVWSYKTRMFKRTIQAWVEQGEELLLENTFIWVCFFW